MTSSDNRNKETRKPKSWDLFPSFRLMAFAVALTILLNLFCGIKIMNLESERNQLRLEKVTIDERAKNLETNIASHSKILKELPELKSRHIDMSTSIAVLEGKLSELTNRETALIQNINTLQNDLNTAVENRKQAEAATKAARKETGRLQSDISELKSEESSLSLDAAKLRQNTVRLKSQVKKLTDQVQTLEAKISNLVKTKEARISEIESLTEDNSRILKIGSHLEKLAADMERSRQKAENAAGLMGDVADKAEHTIATLTNNSQATGNAISDLKTSHEKLAYIVEEIRKDRSGASTAVADLARVGSEAKVQIQRLTTQLDTPIKALSSNTVVLDKHVQNFNTNAQILQTNTRRLEEMQRDIAKASATLNNKVQAAEQALQEFTTFMGNFSSNRSSDENTGQSIENAVANIKTVLSEATDTLKDVRKLREETSTALLSNGRQLKNILENMVRDVSELQQEILIRLKALPKQTNQQESAATNGSLYNQ